MTHWKKNSLASLAVVLSFSRSVPTTDNLSPDWYRMERISFEILPFLFFPSRENERDEKHNRSGRWYPDYSLVGLKEIFKDSRQFTLRWWKKRNRSKLFVVKTLFFLLKGLIEMKWKRLRHTWIIDVIFLFRGEF